MSIGFIYAIVAAVLWGLVYSIDEKILSDSSPALLLFLYSVLATLLLLPFVILDDSTKTLAHFSKTTWILILGSAVLATIANFMIFAGIKNLNASTVTVIEITYPCFVILFSFLLYRTVPNIYFYIGSIFIFIGAVIIIKLA